MVHEQKIDEVTAMGAENALPGPSRLQCARHGRLGDSIPEHELRCLKEQPDPA
jgi:hypothetical protein